MGTKFVHGDWGKAEGGSGIVRRNLFGVLAFALAVVVGVLSLPRPAGAVTQKRPGLPANLTIISANTALIISWAPSLDPGTSPVTGYTVVVIHGNTCTPTGPTSGLISGISNDRPQLVHIKASSASGFGRAAYIAGIPGTVQNCS